MKKKIRITKLVRSLTITSPKSPYRSQFGWRISVRTDLNEGCQKNMEIYSTEHYDSSEQIGQIEPGMYVTIIGYQYQFLDGRKKKNRHPEGHVVTQVEEIRISRKKTEKYRTDFEFETFKDSETKGCIHKVLTAYPRY